ncbi:hypothetical protein GPALN_005351 [Globodera pallida]|nr:hypothetical protein GPALN_005351 [Globodera pallida]
MYFLVPTCSAVPAAADNSESKAGTSLNVDNESVVCADELAIPQKEYQICGNDVLGLSASNNHSTEFWVFNDGLGNFSFVCMWVGCQQRLKTLDQLEAHMDQHLAEYGAEALTNIVCQVQSCQILVSSAEELARHMKMHIFHANRILRGLCVVRERCPKVKSCNFAKTSRLVYQGDPLLCEWNSCLEGFTDINEFIEHVELHIQLLSTGSRSKDGFYGCLWNDCKASFGNRTHLLRHAQHHSGDKICACPFCGAFFSHTAGLIKHVFRRQNGDSSLICRFCQKTFADEALLRKHCIRHIKTHKCHFCSLVLTSPYDLNRHVQTVHAKVLTELNFGFYQRSDLNKHVELHFSDAIHECEQCGQKFRWSKQLREHARQHREDFNPTPYECHLCNSRYARGSALSKHFKTIHQMLVPVGFSRFQYKKCQDGLFRLQTKCYVRDNLPTNEEEQNECK